MQKKYLFLFLGFLLIISSACVSTLIRNSKNSLSCRYRTENGQMLELKGLTPSGKEKFYPLEWNGNRYLWSCSKSESKCPLFFSTNRAFLPANLYFVVNDSRDDSVRKQFVDDAMQSCLNDTPHENAKFVEFGIKSQLDAQPTYFHKPFYQKVHTNENLPFGRIIAFGDSLTDNGNVFAGNKQIVQWPYFIGRFSNGYVWVEEIAKKLTRLQNMPVDLYNYAEGGSGTGFIAFNPFSLDKQVELYLSTMENTCPANAWGCSKNKWNPHYDQTLFVILAGANDYMYCAALDTEKRKQNCFCNTAEDCADAVVNGRVFNGNAIKGIRNKILDIIEYSQGKGQDAKYFLVPNLPDIALSPYYTRVLHTRHAQTKFVHQASLSHNNLLKQALREIEQKYPQTRFVNLDLFNFIGNSIKNSNFPPVAAAGIKNTTERCFFGNPTDFSAKFCNDPASYLFWDYIHPSMTAHCVIAEQAISQIYTTFSKTKTYAAEYTQCHNTFINHD